MARSWEEIFTVMVQRRNADSALIQAMIATRDRYNGDMVIALPDVDREPSLPPLAPRILADGIDGTAMRAASARPTIWCPALHPESSTSRKRADDRRRAMYACWHHSSLWDVKLYRSYRHAVGYGTASFLVMPEFDTGRALVEVRDPLTSYPELRAADDIRPPTNVGYVFGRSLEWILARYPEANAYINGLQNKAMRGRVWDTLWDVVEWIDEDHVVIGLLGPRQPAYGAQEQRYLGYSGYELRRWENKAGMCPAVVPRRVTLDRIAGQLTTVLPIADLLDRFTALDAVAAEKAIFPDMVVLGKDGRPPQLVSGPWKDGRTGEVNLVTDADVKLLQSAAGPLTAPLLDRLEKAARMSGGVSPMFGGDNPSSLRTGRAIDTMGGYSVDPRVEEIQKIMARSLMGVNESIAAVEKGYFSGKKIVGFTGWASDNGVIEYDPAKVYESGDSIVQYDFPGSNVSEISVTVGQMTGAELMSKATGRRKHPYIEDPDMEEHQIAIESLDRAIMAGALSQAQNGTLPIADAIRVRQLLEEGKSFVEAWQTAHEEAQARQATQAPPPGPGMAGAPESQPGLSMPGLGSEQPPPAIPGPNDSQMDLKRLIGALNAGRSQ